MSAMLTTPRRTMVALLNLDLDQLIGGRVSALDGDPSIRKISFGQDSDPAVQAKRGKEEPAAPILKR